MSARLIELAAVAAVVGSVAEVDVLSIRADAYSESVDGRYGRMVDMVGIDVHAASQADAARLAEVLGLSEVEGRTTTSSVNGRDLVWRKWRGWVASASQMVPVSVEVTGSDYAEDAVTTNAVPESVAA